MSFYLILLILVTLLFVGVLPTWPHARGCGYLPSATVGGALLVVIVLYLIGRV